MKPSIFKSVFAIVTVLSLASCSHSTVQDGDTTPETVSSDPANTDAVPVGDGSAMELGATDPNAAPGEAPAEAAPSDPAMAAAEAPIDPAAAPSDPAAPTEAPGEASSLVSSDGTAPVDAANTAAAPVGDEPKIAEQELAAPPPAPVETSGEPTAIASSDGSVTAEPAPISEDSAPVSESSGGGSATKYKVRKGDTLMKIAFEQYGDLYRWREIYEANRGKVKNPNALPPGMSLNLSDAGGVVIERNGDKYLIKTGDTLGLISSNVYGTPRKWKSLWENNRQLIKDPNKIYAGFYLYYTPSNRLTGTVEDRDPASLNPADGQLEAKAAPEADAPPAQQ